MRNAGIAAGVSALIGLMLYGSFVFAAGTVSRLIQWVYRVRDGQREREKL